MVVMRGRHLFSGPARQILDLCPAGAHYRDSTVDIQHAKRPISRKFFRRKIRFKNSDLAVILGGREYRPVHRRYYI